MTHSERCAELSPRPRERRGCSALTWHRGQAEIAAALLGGCLWDGKGAEPLPQALLLPSVPDSLEEWHVGKLFKSVFVFNFSPRKTSEAIIMQRHKVSITVVPDCPVCFSLESKKNLCFHFVASPPGTHLDVKQVCSSRMLMRCSTACAESVFGTDPGVTVCAVLLTVSIFTLGLNCPSLQGTVPEVEWETSGSPFRDAAARHLLGRAGLMGRAVCGRWLPACLLLGSHGVFNTVSAQKEDLSSERAGGQLQEWGTSWFPWQEP